MECGTGHRGSAMRGRVRQSTVVLVVAGFLSASSLFSASAATLDANFAGMIASPIGQTGIAHGVVVPVGITGMLDSIAVHMNRNADMPIGDLTISVHSALFTEPLLFTQTFSSSILPIDPDQAEPSFEFIPFSVSAANITVHAGDILGIWIVGDNESAVANWSVSGKKAVKVAKKKAKKVPGEEGDDQVFNTAWIAAFWDGEEYSTSSRPFGIQTYVEGSEVPVPAALPLFAAGIGVVAFVARRNRRRTTIA